MGSLELRSLSPDGVVLHLQQPVRSTDLPSIDEELSTIFPNGSEKETPVLRSALPTATKVNSTFRKPTNKKKPIGKERDPWEACAIMGRAQS